MRMLIAEDDYVSRIYLYKVLTPYGSCDMTKDGIETIDVFFKALNEDKAYDLILLDIMMPRIDGLRILKEIRNIENKRKVKKSKIVMVSALNDCTVSLEAEKLGCDVFLNKPIERTSLLNII